MAHVALVIHSLTGGGAERSVLLTARGLAAAGYKVDIVLFEPTLAYPEEVPPSARLIVLRERAGSGGDFPEWAHWQPDRASSARLVALAPNLFAQYAATARILFHSRAVMRVLRLIRYFEQERPDIVFANLLGAEYAALFAARLADPAPEVVPVLRNADEPASKNAKRRRALLTPSTRFVAVSQSAAHSAAALGLSEDRIAVIYNPREIDGNALALPDHPWFSDGGPPIVLGAGWLIQQKDFRSLIDAVHRVRDNRSCRLMILGQGPMRDDLERHAATLGMENAVSLPGWVDNPYDFMAHAALFVLSSRFEGLPGVLIEALACGCPSVSTDCPGGSREILEDPDLLAPVGDPEALAQVMLRALSRPVDKNALRAKAARFSVDRTVAGYEKLIAEILA